MAEFIITHKIIEGLLLGIIQGITEFLPISSSAHLEVFPWLFNWTKISDSFEIALHIGTLFALIVFFFKDGLTMVQSGLAVGFIKIKDKFSKQKGKYKLDKSKINVKEGNLFWYIVSATIPAGIISLILEKIVDNIVGEEINIHIVLIAIASIIMGVLLYFVDKKKEVSKSYDDLSFKDTFIIGISQALAATFPGVSRSGVTITTSRLLEYDRKSSAKISFFLSIPMILAAVIVKLKDFDFTYPIAFFLGIFCSFIVGLIVIKYLFKFLEKGDYKVFAIYRVVFGIALIIALVIKSQIA